MEGAREVVVDASVIIKWFSRERDSEVAIRIRDEHVAGRLAIIAPDLMVYEVSNALRYNPSFGPDDVRGAIRDIFDMDLDLIAPNEEVLGKAIEHASKLGLTVYDACYIALAESMGLELITGDEKLYGKAKELGFVRYLGEMGGRS
jgi:predicted nucleic acid-binding protein